MFATAFPGVGITLPLIEDAFGFLVARRFDLVEGEVLRDGVAVSVGAGQLEDAASDEVGTLGGVLDVLVDEPLVELLLLLFAGWLSETDENEVCH